jgi:hypothetical protein
VSANHLGLALKLLSSSALVLLLASLGVVQSSLPASASSTGTVWASPCLNLRNGPNVADSLIGCIPYKTRIVIICTSSSNPPVSGPWGATSLWDETTWNSQTGFVSDAWVYTGTANAVAPACSNSPSTPVSSAPTTTPVLTKATAANHILVVSATNTSYWADAQGVPHWIQTAAIYQCLVGHGYAVLQNLTQAQVNSLGNGQPWATCSSATTAPTSLLNPAAIPAYTGKCASVSSAYCNCVSGSYVCVTPGYNPGPLASDKPGPSWWAWQQYGGANAGSLTDPHNCTLYVAYLLELEGMTSPPGGVFNALDWNKLFPVVGTPTVGDVAWFKPGSWNGTVGSLGHVGWVAAVSGSKFLLLSDNAFINETQATWVSDTGPGGPSGFLVP